MARYNKMFVKKLYMPDGKLKGQNDKLTRVTATASDLNKTAGGSYTGNVTGNVTGDVTGDVTADVIKSNSTTYSDQTTDLDGVTLNNYIVLDANAAVVTLTNATFQLGAMYTIYCSRADLATTLTLKSPATFDGTNNKATFDEEDAISFFATAAGKFHILENDGVLLSAV
jgi:hypothetical protein